MLRPEQWKEEIARDPSVMKELEEYVKYLTAEYFDRSDHRRTKLFRQIEEAHRTFPDNEIIAVEYSCLFVLLDGIAYGARGKKARKEMADLHRKFPANPDIAGDYAFLLSFLPDRHDSEQCRELLDIVEALNRRFPDHEDIPEHLVSIRQDYESALEYERLSAEREALERALGKTPDDEALTARYAGTLADLAGYVSMDECEQIRKIVAGLGSDFREQLARVDTALIDWADEDRAWTLLGEVERIYKAAPSDAMVEIFADALITVCGNQDDHLESLVRKAATLHTRHPEHPDAAAAYAYALSVKMEYQQMPAAKNTLKKLFALAQDHPGNEDVQSYLEEAKASFAMDHEDDVFWESPVEYDCIAVLDTETTWSNRLMSVGVVIADRQTLRPLDFLYCFLTPECHEGGIYSTVVPIPNSQFALMCRREEAVRALRELLGKYRVDTIYGYNVAFDRGKLPELGDFSWFDIMPIAANRNSNDAIPGDAACFKSGRMKRGYGVEPMLRLLRGSCEYEELHNALFDAMDELRIMQHLGYTPASYAPGALPEKASGITDPNTVGPADFNLGDRIFHAAFGHGIITVCLPLNGLNENKFFVTATFIRIGDKQLVLPRDHARKE